jgi:xyloglucan-specific exo-beta-1,4-glucanase
MRKKLAGAIAAVTVAASVAVAVVALNAGGAQAATSEPYTWKNARIDGGGFVPGIIFNPTEQNLIYARTDIGGAYRWNQSTSSWIPLLDWVGWGNWGWLGVTSLATDPVQTNKVYASVGMYLNSWDPNNGAILRSSDKGATWQSTTLPFKVGGNMPGRGQGERLAVDPNRNSTLYFGAEAGQGLWRSTDSGVTWAKVANFPNAGNYVQDPTDSNQYLTFNQGVTWVAFDKSTGTAGNTTQGIYVGVADLQNTVYRSLNGGTSWERLAGQPTGFMAHQGEVVAGNLYITTSDKGGPYDGSNGQVWKYTIASSTWTNISPPVIDGSATRWYGYAGLSVDKQNPNTIMVTGYSSWYPDTIIHRSTDGGATWRTFYDYAWPNRTNHYNLDISSDPWLTFNDQKSLPEQVPKLGWMTEALEIDPFNSNRMMFGTGATIYGTTNLSALDTGGTVNLAPMVKGLEETAVLDLVSPPSGAGILFSGLGDIGGFRHTNLDAVPGTMYNQPFMGTTTSLDYDEGNPMWMVRVGKTDRTGATTVAWSTDQGANWFQSTPPSGAQGGQVAMNNGHTHIVWSTQDNGVWFSDSAGGSFSQASGAPAAAKVAADRVNPNKFYAFGAGNVYVSTNGGHTFTQAATGLGNPGHIKAVPGVDGEVWVASDTGIWRSTNSGSTFTKIAASTSAVGVGFGKAAPGRTNMAVYTMATIDNVRGVYRSNDSGATWVRINDDAHQYGNAGDAITGDPRIYGRVYMGTNGRGVVYADPSGGSADTTAPTTPGTPTASNVTSTGATLNWTASTDNVGVTGYDVIDASNTVIASTTTNSANLTGLTPSTQFVLRVRAKDAAGNLSTPSGSVTFTTAAPPVDTTAPTVPTNLAAPNPTSTSVTLTWTASTDNVGVTGYDIFRAPGASGGTFASVGTSTTTTFTNTGLTAGSTFRYQVRAKDAAGNLSAFTAALTVTTPTGGDTQAPTVPTNLAAGTATSSSVPLTWTASTDNVGVTGYDIFRATGASGGTFASVGTSTGASFTDTTVAASTTYRYQVRAKDAAGNLSAFTAAVSVTTPAGTTGGCSATYTIVNSWPGGFSGNVDVRNNGTTATSAWTVTWAFANGQVITQLWNGTVTQTGANVTVHNVSYNGTIAPNGVTSFGFNANWNNATNAVPTVTCSPS